jgi:hypothetical protein
MEKLIPCSFEPAEASNFWNIEVIIYKTYRETTCYISM